MMSASKNINKIVKRLSLTFSEEFCVPFLHFDVCVLLILLCFFFYDFNNLVFFKFLRK